MGKLCLGRKMIICAIIFLLVTGFKSHAQLNPAMGSSQWKYANPFQYGLVMNDISFVDNNNALAVGTNGAIGKSTDGGYNWQYLLFKYITNTNTVSLQTINDVHFVTPAIAYAVGTGGLMIKSTDGGLNWTQITTPLTPFAKNINGLHFINKDTGYIGGASLLTTNTADVNCAPKVYVTRNGGATWDSLTTPFVRQTANAALNWNNTKEIQRIYFVNDSVGYVSGSAGNEQAPLLWKIEKTVVTDYCPHKSKFGIATGSYIPSTHIYKGLIAANDSTVLMSGFNANVVIRVKTGKNDSTANALPATYGSYSKGAYQVVVWLNSTATPFPASLVAAGVAGQTTHLKKAPNGNISWLSGGKVASTTDNGTTWSASQQLAPYSWWTLTAMDVAPNGRVVVSGDGGMLYDSLPGTPWRTQYRHVRPIHSTDFSTGLPSHFAAIDWADYCNGILVGGHGTFVKTNDGGKTWVNNTNLQMQASGTFITNVAYPNTNNIFFTTPNNVWKSADQGTTNIPIFTEPNTATQGFNTNYFTMVGQDRAFLVGFRAGTNVQRAVIFRTLNASAATPVWDTVKSFPTSTFAPNFRNIRFANADTGYVTATRGKVYRTADGGNTWTDVSPDTTAPGNATATYTALSVINGKTLYVGGSSKKIFKSTDAGATWTNLTLALTTPATITDFSSIAAIEMNDANNGYAMTGSFLLKTTDGWATWTYDMAPIGFANMKLYPKINAPIQNKKLFYVGTVQIGFDFSRNPATLLEYGNAAAYNTSTTETITNASCTNPAGGSITINATGGLTPYTYSINGGTPQSSNVFGGLTTGNKTITIRDAACQVITKTIMVPFTDNLTLTANNDTTVCANAPVQMLATANLAGTTFAWSPATGLTNAGIANPVAITEVGRTYTVTATLNGCVRTEPVVISIKANPVISAGPDKTIVVGDQVTLDGAAGNAVSIAWTPNATLTGANTLTPIAKPIVMTNYTLTVLNNQGCTSTDVATVNVIPYCIKVMNAFTPNGDGINDKWLATDGNACTKQISVAVHNRYGNIVYKNDNYNNDWNGTYNGKAIPDGTYYYVITYKTITNNTIFAKGDVTILR